MEKMKGLLILVTLVISLSNCSNAIRVVGDIKRLVPSGPNSEISPSSSTSEAFSDEPINKFSEIKHKVRSNPNPEECPSSPSSKRFYVEPINKFDDIKHEVPAGPSPIGNP